QRVLTTLHSGSLHSLWDAVANYWLLSGESFVLNTSSVLYKACHFIRRFSLSRSLRVCVCLCVCVYHWVSEHAQSDYQSLFYFYFCEWKGFITEQTAFPP